MNFTIGILLNVLLEEKKLNLIAKVFLQVSMLSYEGTKKYRIYSKCVNYS